MNVLIAYASRHGATAGIADRIAQRLRSHGHQAVATDVEEVGELAGYDAFVVGSAAYMHKWLKAATRFVRKNTKTLEAKPLWLFSSGPVGTDLVDEKGRDIFEAMRPRQFDDFKSLGPVDAAVFFGALEIREEPKGTAERFMSWMPDSWMEDMPTGDFRDWDAIDKWADEIDSALTGR